MRNSKWTWRNENVLRFNEVKFIDWNKSFSSIHSQLNENVLSTTNLNFYQDFFAFFSFWFITKWLAKFSCFCSLFAVKLWSDNKENKNKRSEVFVVPPPPWVLTPSSTRSNFNQDKSLAAIWESWKIKSAMLRLRMIYAKPLKDELEKSGLTFLRFWDRSTERNLMVNRAGGAGRNIINSCGSLREIFCGSFNSLLRLRNSFWFHRILPI